MQFSVVAQVFSWCEAVIESCVLRQDTDGGTHFSRLSQQIIARNRGCPASWFQQSAEKSHGSCLASAVRAKKTEDFTVTDFEIDLVYSGESSKLLSQ